MSEGHTERLNTALKGRYHVVRQLGEGAMATVYLADDIKHERKVALKVLKPDLAAVVGAERFLAEIKTTANLHHPNILPLFDSGEADTFLFYVMPYLEGETLRDSIDREKQLPVDEAVRIATAVASALDHAHRHKVIHRDIKPANILLQDGQPVVSDFGIALAVGVAGGGRLTETGLSLGTPHYMSPEQATGDLSVGAATDIYALGCVLYEMLVGEPPYTGSTAQAILGKIIAGKPVLATEQRPSIPANVDAALRKALEKLPADRFMSAPEFVRALGDGHFRYGEEAAVGAVGPWKQLAAVGWILSAVAILVAGWAHVRPSPSRLITRVSVSIPEDQAFDPIIGTFDISRDGSAMVYKGITDGVGRQYWVRRWNELDAAPIPGTEGFGGGGIPQISPDGREVLLLNSYSLQAVPIDGGLPRTLSDSVACCPRWSPDGEWVFYTNPAGGLNRVPSDGGAPQVITRVDGPGSHRWVDVLPGGRAAVYQGSGSRIQAVDLETDEIKELSSGAYPRYSPTGHLLFIEAGGSTLFAAPFDLDRLELTGPAVPVVEGLRQHPNGWQYYAFSETGTLLYSTGRAVGEADTELVWVTRTGSSTPVHQGWQFNSGFTTNLGWSLSPDGSRVAVRIGTAGNDDIWIKQLPDGPLDRLTVAPAPEGQPWWTPDGRTVMYMESLLNVWSKLADGTGEAELVLGSARTFAQGLWSPDGEYLILRSGGSEEMGLLGARDLYSLRPNVDSVPVPLVVTEWSEQAPALSPDGNWLAYSSDETGRHEVFVRPFPNVNSAKVTVSTQGGRNPEWAHSGRELFFLAPDNAMIAVQIETTSGFRVGEQDTLFTVPSDYYVNLGQDFYDVAPDDQRFLMGRRLQGDPITTGAGRLILVLNFFEELKERVPN